MFKSNILEVWGTINISRKKESSGQVKKNPDILLLQQRKQWHFFVISVAPLSEAAAAWATCSTNLKAAARAAPRPLRLLLHHRLCLQTNTLRCNQPHRLQAEGRSLLQKTRYSCGPDWSISLADINQFSLHQKIINLFSNTVYKWTLKCLLGAHFSSSSAVFFIAFWEPLSNKAPFIKVVTNGFIDG